MIDNPKFAPARPDLTFLRRRVRPKQTPPPPMPGPSSGGTIDYTRHDREAPAATPAPAPTTPPPTPVRAADPIDYSRPDGPPAPAPSSGGSLDLSDPPPPPERRAPAASPTPELSASEAWQRRHVVRARGTNQLLMNMREPTATLTRVQSGVGQLEIEAVCSPEIGDLRLGAAYQLRSGGTGIVQHAGGNRFAPSSRRPVITGSREEYERLGIDLRQVSDIERIAVYAFSESRSDITWGGTLVVSTFGGARMELPLETLYAGRVAVLMTFYNMDGELVVRAELETIAGDIREAARAYGFDRITWRDERSPVD